MVSSYGKGAPVTSEVCAIEELEGSISSGRYYFELLHNQRDETTERAMHRSAVTGRGYLHPIAKASTEQTARCRKGWAERNQKRSGTRW
jgi:hypothetical protein